MMKASVAVILSAGRGTRMNSARPTALHEVAGKPIIDWMLAEVRPCVEAAPVVVDGKEGCVAAHVGEDARIAVQAEPLGEAGALRAAARFLEDAGDGFALILWGNLPLVDKEYFQAAIDAAGRYGAAKLVYSDEETGALADCGVYCAKAPALCKILSDVPETAPIEECMAAIEGQGTAVHTLMVSQLACLAVVDRETLAFAQSLANGAIIKRHMHAGVTVLDPAATYIGADVQIGQDTVLWPNVILTGNTVIGTDCVIKSGCQLNDTRVGMGCTLQYVVANEAEIGNRVTAGPFVNLRPATRISDGCKIGDFVEVKNSNVGEGTKLPHLSYIGDADVGSGVNVGCGCVFVNYDGFSKHRTTVGDNVFLGCQTNLVAPVTVGDGAYTAAGSTITKDVPPGAMAFARVRQTNKEGYVEKFQSLKKK